jgi:hypothetical protein
MSVNLDSENIIRDLDGQNSNTMNVDQVCGYTFADELVFRASKVAY